MPLSTQSQPGEQHVFVASLDNARNLSNILKAIAFKDHAIFSATPNGLKVTVEDSKCLQANAFIQADIFQEFTIREDLVGFQINLTVLLDCLNIFGGSAVSAGMSTVLKMCYRGYGYPLTLFLEEAGVVTVVHLWQFRKCPLRLPERFRHDGFVPVHKDTNQQVGAGERN
uniref:RAD1 homolog (S. pombe) n=1 Tax=Takifugu rubripes TaxID=31033 RepID=A0A674NQQ1_TAKRU